MSTTEIKKEINQITVSNFINTFYRDYWNYSNMNGKNSVTPKEQLPEVVRKIIYAAYQLNIKEGGERKTNELLGEVVKYHPHGNSSIEDSIKGVATAYKSQPAVRFLQGIGNFGSAPGDEGAAGRYTSIAGTPLLTAVYRDIPFVPMSTDDTGVEQPEYISIPLPVSLITGMSSIGTGKSCYIAERDAREIIKWIDELRKNNWDHSIEAPEPMSVTGCKTWFNHDNGYVYYDAVIHEGVDMNDINKKGKFDIITNLPPKSTPDTVIYKLQQKLPARATKGIIDGSGKGKPTWIVVPKGYIEEKDFAKYGLRLARKEQILVWDEELTTMRLIHNNGLHFVAERWFKDRCSIVTKRLNKQVSDLKSSNHFIDLIRIFAENKMQDWKSEDIVSYFVKLDSENGEDDANYVLNQPQRRFLPENLASNEEAKKKNESRIKDLNKQIKNVGDVVISEAYDIIDKQEKFFNAI